MTSSQLILVSVTSAIVAVFTMLVVATILRARGRDDSEDETSGEPSKPGGSSKKDV